MKRGLENPPMESYWENHRTGGCEKLLRVVTRGILGSRENLRETLLWSKFTGKLKQQQMSFHQQRCLPTSKKWLKQQRWGVHYKDMGNHLIINKNVFTSPKNDIYITTTKWNFPPKEDDGVAFLSCTWTCSMNEWRKTTYHDKWRTKFWMWDKKNMFTSEELHGSCRYVYIYIAKMYPMLREKGVQTANIR